MQIVIDISEGEYQTYINHTEAILDSSIPLVHQDLLKAVINGTPLPKRHGRLVDFSEVLIKLMQFYDGDKSIGQCLDEVNTIIETDRSERSDKE